MWCRLKDGQVDQWKITESREELILQSLKFKGSLEAKYLLPGGPSVLWPLTDYMRPTHIMEDNRIYSKSTDLNVNHILIFSQQH